MKRLDYIYAFSSPRRLRASYSLLGAGGFPRRSWGDDDKMPFVLGPPRDASCSGILFFDRVLSAGAGRRSDTSISLPRDSYMINNVSSRSRAIEITLLGSIVCSGRSDLAAFFAGATIRRTTIETTTSPAPGARNHRKTSCTVVKTTAVSGIRTHGGSAWMSGRGGFISNGVRTRTGAPKTHGVRKNRCSSCLGFDLAARGEVPRAALRARGRTARRGDAGDAGHRYEPRRSGRPAPPQP